jgi:hypothetical protein
MLLARMGRDINNLSLFPPGVSISDIDASDVHTLSAYECSHSVAMIWKEPQRQHNIIYKTINVLS